jgi:hypothetical protein
MQITGIEFYPAFYMGISVHCQIPKHFNLNNAIGVHEAKVNPADIETTGLIDFNWLSWFYPGYQVQSPS